MEYVIVRNNSDYLRFDSKKKISRTSNFALAERFSYVNAKLLIKNNIKPKERSLYSIVEDEYSEPPALQNANTIYEADDFSWRDTSELIQRFFSELDIYKSRLEKMYDEVQGEITDLYHKIEFPKSNGKEYNASEGTKLFVLLRDALRRFRKIKDDLKYIHIISESNLDDFKNGHVMDRINGMENREYRPRVLDELFVS